MVMVVAQVWCPVLSCKIDRVIQAGARPGLLTYRLARLLVRSLYHYLDLLRDRAFYGDVWLLLVVVLVTASVFHGVVIGVAVIIAVWVLAVGHLSFGPSRYRFVGCCLVVLPTIGESHAAARWRGLLLWAPLAIVGLEFFYEEVLPLRIAPLLKRLESVVQCIVVPPG